MLSIVLIDKTEILGEIITPNQSQKEYTSGYESEMECIAVKDSKGDFVWLKSSKDGRLFLIPKSSILLIKSPN